MPQILEHYDPKTGRFGTGVWIVNDQQDMYPLAVAYGTKSDSNPYYKSQSLLEVIIKSGELLVEKMDETAVIYKSIGALLVKSKKAKVTTELTERKELLKMRVDVLAKQEERLKTQVKDLQEKLQRDLSPVSGSS